MLNLAGAAVLSLACGVEPCVRHAVLNLLLRGVEPMCGGSGEREVGIGGVPIGQIRQGNEKSERRKRRAANCLRRREERTAGGPAPGSGPWVPVMHREVWPGKKSQSLWRIKGIACNPSLFASSHCTYQLTGPNPLPIKCHWAVDEAGACVGRIQGGQNNSAAN